MPMKTAITISAPAARVWRILTDTRQWPTWGPSIRAVDCPDRHIRAGSRGRVRTAGGIWLRFRVTAFVPGRYWAWRVAGVPATGHRVEPTGERACRLSFEVPVPAAPYLLVCRVACRRIAALAERG